MVIKPPGHRPVLARYGVALAAVAVAWMLREVLTPLWGPTALPFIFFYPAIVVAAWYGRFRPSLLAIAVSALSADFFFVRPRFSILAGGPSEVIALTTFVLACLCISGAIEAMHRANERAVVEVAKRSTSEEALRESEGQQRLMADIGGIFESSLEPDSLVSAVVRRVAEHFKVSRCGYARVDLDSGNIIVEREYHHNLPALQGLFPISQYASHLVEDALAGRTSSMPDLSKDSRTAAMYEERFAPLRIRSYINIPLLRDGKWVAMFWVSDHDVRDWTPVEIGIMRTIADRIWLALEKARVTRELRRSQEQLRFITDHVPVLLVHCDAEGRYLFVNPAYAKRFKLDPVQIVGKRIPEVVGTAAYEKFRPYVETALSGQVVEFEEEIPYAFGKRYMHAIYVPQKEKNGKVTGFVAVIQDTTQRKRHEAKLAEQAHLLDLSNDAIIVRDAGERITYWNRGAEELYGYSRAEAVGRVIKDLLRTEYPESLESIHRILLTEDRWAGEVIHTCKDGTRITCFSRWSLDRDASGNPASILETNNNITDRKQTEKVREQLLKSEQQLRQLAEDANRLKDQFLATLSHELRNPLNVILGYSEVLLRDSQITESPQLSAMAQALRRNAQYQSGLIRDLLDLSRLQTGKISLTRETVPLLSVVTNAIETVKAEAQTKLIVIEVVAPDGEVLINGDSLRIEQIVWNLLNNAVKFTPSGGRIGVRLWKKPDHVLVEVEDSGEGIDAEFLPHLFDNFTQADSSTTRVQSGLGIGLALVRQLVELHQGSITAHSTGKNCGSRFTVRLPFRAAAMLATSPEGGLKVARLDQIEILVLDDSEDSTEMLRHLLEISGASVKTATSAVDALRIAGEKDFDIVVSDISMPGMDGFEFLRRFRELPGKKDVPVLALTGFGRTEDIQRAQHAGFYSHLTKPFDLQALSAILEELSRRKVPLTSQPQSFVNFND